MKTQRDTSAREEASRARAPDVLDLLAPCEARFEAELRRLAWQLVDEIIAAERASRAAEIARTLERAFDLAAARPSGTDKPAPSSPDVAHRPVAAPQPPPVLARTTMPHRDDQPDGEDDAPRVEGIVKWFDDVKGFGFIANASGDDVFVHHKNIAGRGFRSLVEGESVRYREHQGPCGRYATSVRRIEGDVTRLSRDGAASGRVDER